MALLVRNHDHRPNDYTSNTTADITPRPSHADYSYLTKYGVLASSGGGRASARETVGRVAAGAVAEKWLKEKYSISIVAYVSSVGNICRSFPFLLLALCLFALVFIDVYYIGMSFPIPSLSIYIYTPSLALDRSWERNPSLSRELVDSSLVRCPDAAIADQMTSLITKIKSEGDSIGGVITCVVKHVPTGLGEFSLIVTPDIVSLTLTVLTSTGLSLSLFIPLHIHISAFLSVMHYVFIYFAFMNLL